MQSLHVPSWFIEPNRAASLPSLLFKTLVTHDFTVSPTETEGITYVTFFATVYNECSTAGAQRRSNSSNSDVALLACPHGTRPSPRGQQTAAVLPPPRGRPHRNGATLGTLPMQPYCTLHRGFLSMKLPSPGPIMVPLFL